jgi:aspartate-semialdehyde dehydrogenase
MAKSVNVAVVGATGAVGNCMLQILAERKFPIKSLKLLASERSIGKSVSFQGKNYTVELLKENSFKGIDIALFSAGADRSKVFAPLAAAAGAVVVDNTSFFRMDPGVPLVVPEVNKDQIQKHNGIIANPNCSTIGMVVALNPIHKAAKIKRIVVTTFQSVSGAGQSAIAELQEQTRAWAKNEPIKVKKFQHQIVFNVIPHIDSFLENGYTKEEMKMVNETKKIMGDPFIKVTATCVRVPVFFAHSESVNIETERKLKVQDVRDLLQKAAGIELLDDTANSGYPMPLQVGGKDNTFVGRIREDESVKNGLNLWVVSDNLRKGAALNAIQIAEELIRS